LVQDRFHVKFDPKIPIKFVYLSNRWIVEAKYYPRFTMIGQSLGSVLLSFEALWKQPCSLFCDSTGYAFTYPVAKIFFGSQVLSYTHYPTISTDMIDVVKTRTGTYNNNASVSQSTFKSSVKLIYYRLFALAYGIAGSFANVVMVNSSWTMAHIVRIWKPHPSKIQLVFPPCDTSYYQTFPLDPREPMVLSIGQFRPEKNHKLQIQSVLKYNKSENGKKRPVKLVMIGGVRNDEDRERVAELRRYAEESKADQFVQFELNAPAEVLDDYYKRSLIGIHTMWNEHFGIGVVEMMAAGMFTIAHNTGGPRADIVLEGSGYLAETAEEYAEAIDQIVWNQDKLTQTRPKARKHIEKFSDENFRRGFYDSISNLLPQ
jgi:alpha-1,2-mannosyltransferase